MRRLTLIKFIVFFTFIHQSVYTQKRTLEDLEAALVLKLCDYITWETDTNKNYTLGIISTNTDLIQSLKNITPQLQIHAKPVKLIPLKELPQNSTINILFIDEHNRDILPHINDFIKGKDILLFTENHVATNEFMFNLLVDDKKGMVSFEFNRANLIFEGFEIHPDIIELRGSEIDVRDLYRQTRNRLESEEDKVDKLSDKLKDQTISIQEQQEQIKQQNDEILKKNSIILHQSNTIDSKEQHLKKLNQQLQTQVTEITEKQELLSNLQNEVALVNISLDTQKTHLENQMLILDTLNSSIRKKQKTIEEKERIVEQKEYEIDFRNKAIYALFGLSILTLVLLIAVYRTNKANKRARVTLANQKEELQTTLDKLTQAQNQLIQSEKMASLGVLVAGIAHEINNPINFISTGISGLKSTMDDILLVLNKYREKYADVPESDTIRKLENEIELSFLLESNHLLFDNIKTGVERTVSIIRSLKVFSHDNDKKETVDLHENIDLALTILHNQYKYTIEIEKNYGELPRIECFPGKMNQVFVNLITNAVQAIEDKGTIKISTWLRDNFVFVKIWDNGCGIPEDIQHKIFDPFFTTKEVGKGTGMGLSLVYNIIQKHNGEIVLNSQTGEFSEFIIKLPLRIQ